MKEGLMIGPSTIHVYNCYKNIICDLLAINILLQCTYKHFYDILLYNIIIVPELVLLYNFCSLCLYDNNKIMISYMKISQPKSVYTILELFTQ